MRARTKPDYETIVAAVNGDIKSIENIIQIYRGYILTCSKNDFVDEENHHISIFDDVTAESLENKLREAIPKFKGLKTL